MTSPSASRTASPDGLDDGTVALRDHIKLLTGYPFKSEFYTEQPDGVRLVRGDNVVQGQLRWDNVKRWPLNRIDEASGYELREGDVVLAMDRPWIEAGLKYARIGSDDVPSLLVQRVSCLRAKDGLDQGYLFYLIGSHRFTDHVLSIQTGTAVPHISGPQILQFRYRPLPIDRQRAIAAVLGSLDDKIEQNRRTARALERLARAIFRAWFVDFEPVKAKAAGAASFPSMPQAVFEALPTTFTDSDLGPVPEGWEVKAMSECMVLTMGQSPPSEHYNEVGEGLPFHQGVTDYGFRFPTHRVYCTVAARLAEAKDVLLSVRAPVGRINVADQRLVLGRGLAGVRHPRGAQSFVLHQLSHAFAEEDAVGDGTIYKAVTKQFLSQMATLSPTTSVIDCFESIAQPLDAQVFALEMETRNLVSLRDYLLPQLLSGQVPVEVGDV